MRGAAIGLVHRSKALWWPNIAALVQTQFAIAAQQPDLLILKVQHGIAGK